MLDKELRRFRRTAQVLSRRHPRMIDAYPKQWVGVYHGKVAATGKTLTALLTALDKQAVPCQKVLIRFITKDERTLILPVRC